MGQKDLIRRIKERLEEEFEVETVYLFGSRAAGTFHAESDYDIAVVSPHFEAMSFHDRQMEVRSLIHEVLGDEPLDVACYTPTEFERGKDGFLPEIIEREGISV